MDSQYRTNEQLLKELSRLKLEIKELEKSECEHKKDEVALRQERILYMDLANAQPSGIYRLRVFSTKRFEDEKWHSSKDSPCAIEFINDRFCEILNLNRQIITNNPSILNDFVLEIDKTEFARKNVDANLNMTPFLWEGRFCINGAILWVHLESLPRLMECGDTMWTGILYDITERKKAEHEIKLKNEELQKINAEKDKFFSIIAHDLKTPLGFIVGFSELLVEQIRKKDIQVIEKYANTILRSSNRTMELLMNLMEWSQSQTGRMVFNPDYFEIVNIIDESTLLFTDFAEQKSITITKELPSKMNVYVDKTMISTVLRNLISNAIKFTCPGGKIIISAEENQSEVTIKICDTGVGIPKDTIRRLFLINENQSTRGTQNEYGSGLGLILCKEFTEKHGGKIWVESETEKGSKFYFTLPYKKEPDEKIEKKIKKNDTLIQK